MALVQRVGKAAFNGTQADQYTRIGLGDLGQPAGILIGQRIDGDMRELLADGIVNLIDKAQHRPHMGILFFVHGPALFAGAVIAPVILTDGKDRAFRMFQDGFAQVLQGYLENLRIGQAQLRALLDPDAVDFGEIFRVLIEIFVRRHQTVKGMHAQIADCAAVAGHQPVIGGVRLVPSGPVPVKILHVKGLADTEGRCLCDIQLRQGDIAAPGDAADLGCIPAAAQVILEEGIYAV